MAASDVEYRCFVGGLAWATDDNSLHTAFSTYGEVLESKVRPFRPSLFRSDPSMFRSDLSLTCSSEGFP